MDVNDLVKELEKILLPNKIKLFPGATSEEIEKAQSKLNIKFPQELVDVLMLSDGVNELMYIPNEDKTIVIDDVYWPVESIINGTFEHDKYLEMIESKHKIKYLCFADNGCGEHFGYKFIDGKCEDTTIYVYYPIEDKYNKVATNLAEWAIGWYLGKIIT